MSIRVKNRGTGAGGKNTNANGLSHEKKVCLMSEFEIIKEEKLYNEIKFKGSSKTFKITRKAKFRKLLKESENTKVKAAHGCKEPDECYIDDTRKIIFIFEHKFQRCSGSVCEKIQTAEFKHYNYSRRYPDYKIVYSYILSSWFVDNCESELEYLKKKCIPVFINNSDNFKSDVVRMIINNKF